MAKQRVWYHGGRVVRNWDDLSWDRDRTTQSLNQEGPGMYWTSDYEEAATYMDRGPDGIVYEATLKDGFSLVKPKAKPTLKALTELFQAASADHQQRFVEDFGFESVSARSIKESLQNYLHQDSFLDAAVVLSSDLFHHDAEAYVEAMRSIGYDGFIVQKGTTGGSKAREHLISFSPHKMRIKESAGEMEMNPKLQIKWMMHDDETSFREFLNESAGRKHAESRDIELNLSDSGLLTWWGMGKRMLLVNIASKRILTFSDVDSPTNVHILKQIYDEMPEWHNLNVGEYLYLRGDGKVVWSDTGVSLKNFVRDLKFVSGSFSHKRSRNSVEVAERQYWAKIDPTETRWYHATLGSNLDSIMKTGLLPSASVKSEGWSPSWNIEKQNAIYITSSLLYASRIAETLANGAKETAVVIEIDGRALNPSRLIADEDALRDDYDASVNYGEIDIDFPDYVTSWFSGIRSIASLDKISPKYLSVALVGNYSEEIIHYRDTEEVESSVEFSGPATEELKAILEEESE